MDNADLIFDVVVCGGGLAGLTFTLQLRLEQPDLRVAVLDRQSRPLPDAAFKVGESCVEFGAHYFTEYLQLSDYFESEHITKVGLRYFYGDSQGSLQDRPEVGLSHVHSVKSYQFDRGKLESDLRQMLSEDDGVTLLEGAKVGDLDLRPDQQHHIVTYRDDSTDDKIQLKCKWVVDASGRRQLIQRKLGLKKPLSGNPCSSAWFRFEGRWDVSDLVPESNTGWHDRVPERARYGSTNHLCGAGYWVWVIPLSGGDTSIGIVALEEIHPLDTYNTFPRATAWLEENEPQFAEYIRGQEPLDFKVMRKYSYSSSKVFSSDRWACVGEAGVFADPYYSPGSDLIGIANTLTVDLIRRDFAGELEAKTVNRHSSYVISTNRALANNIQRGYRSLGDGIVQSTRCMWDFAAAWGYQCPRLFSRTLCDEAKTAVLDKSFGNGFFLLSTCVQALLSDWYDARQANGGRFTFEFVDYLSMPWLSEHRLANLRRIDDLDELARQHETNQHTFEELAQAILLIAVEDTHPEKLDELRSVPWLNAWKLVLSPEKWESRDMFSPETEPRDFSRIHREVREKFRVA